MAVYVVCDPILITGIQPTKYVLTMDGGAVLEVDPQKLADNSVRLHYDVSSVSNGSHRLTVAAKNIWGSSSTVPFDFTKSIPATPSGLSLEV